MNMHTLQMLKEANALYPERSIGQLFDLTNGKETPQPYSDTLALFIGREIISVTDDPCITDAEARAAVEEALTTAIGELTRVMEHFRRTL